MKKLLAVMLFVSGCYFTKAQTDYKKKIVDSTCACLNETPGLDTKSPEEIQAAIGQCMMTKSMGDFMALAQERNINMTDQDAMTKLGTEIGMDLMKSDCKAMKNLMNAMVKSEFKAGGKMETIADVKTISGQVQNVNIEGFVFVTVLSNAKATQLVWSDMVEGGNEFAKNLAGLKSKFLSFSYQEKEVYSIKDKAYITVKMITAVNPPEAKAQQLKKN